MTSKDPDCSKPIGMLDVVALKRAFPKYGLPAGSEGTVVEIFENPSHAYLLEFADADGETQAMVVVGPEDVELVWSAAEHGIRSE